MAVVSVDKVAQACNITPRRVQQLVEEGMPRQAHGAYDLGQCMAWYIRYLQTVLETREVPQVDSIAAALRGERQRLTKAQADREEFELRRAQGEVITIALFEERLARMVTSARQRLLMLPSRVAPELEGETRAEIKVKLQRALHSALTALSHGGPNGRRRPRAARPAVLAPDGAAGPGLPANEPALGTATDTQSQ